MSQWHPTPCLYPHHQTDPTCPKLPQTHFSPARYPPSDHQRLSWTRPSWELWLGRDPAQWGRSHIPRLGWKVEGQGLGSGQTPRRKQQVLSLHPLLCGQVPWGPHARTHMRAHLRGPSDSGPAQPACPPAGSGGGRGGQEVRAVQVPTVPTRSGPHSSTPNPGTPEP